MIAPVNKPLIMTPSEYPPETLEQNDALFTNKEILAITELFETIGGTLDKEALSEGDLIELCDTISRHFEATSTTIHNKVQIEALEKARIAKQQMEDDLQLNTFEKIPLAGNNKRIDHHVSQFVKKRGRFPFSIRAQMIALRIVNMLNRDEEVRDLNTDSTEDRKNIELMESFIAACNYWHQVHGLSNPPAIDDPKEIQKQYAQRLTEVNATTQITGSIASTNLIDAVNRYKAELVKRGVIVKKNKEA